MYTNNLSHNEKFSFLSIYFGISPLTIANYWDILIVTQILEEKGGLIFAQKCA